VQVLGEVKRVGEDLRRGGMGERWVPRLVSSELLWARVMASKWELQWARNLAVVWEQCSEL
jgi:hypothetical protein